MKKGSMIIASNPKSKQLIDGKQYKVEWISISNKIAVRNESGVIRPYDRINFKSKNDIIPVIVELEQTGKKLTFGDLEKGDKFICFPTDGDNSGHGGYLGSQNVYIKIDPCYKISTYKIFKTGITKQPALEMNSVCTVNGALANTSTTMNVIKLNN